MVVAYTGEGEKSGPGHEVDSEDGSDDSSVNPLALEGRGGGCDGESVACDWEGGSEPEDPDEYGERLVDEESAQEEVEEANVKKVR